jgi:hypothetical protein
MEFCGQFQDPVALPPGKEPTEPITYEAGWALGLVWTLWKGENLILIGSQIAAVQPVSRPIPTEPSWLPHFLELLFENLLCNTSSSFT